MALAIVEADGLHSVVAFERVTEANGGILAPGKQDQRPGLAAFFTLLHFTRLIVVFCIFIYLYGRPGNGGLAMVRVCAGFCLCVSVLFGACSTIVKGTEQQVSVNTPGVPGAMCQLSSPAIGMRTVQTPANIVLPKSRHNVAVSCRAQCYGPGVGTLASHTEVMTAGNVLFGGFIGLGVDAASGAMNKYDPGVEVMMTPLPGCGRPGRKGVPMAGTEIIPHS
jgi:hypothetical protein